MTLQPEQLEAFMEAFDRAVDERWPMEARQPQQPVDSRARVDELHAPLATLLERLEPFGMENEAPIWGLEEVELSQGRTMAEGKHLRAQAVDPPHRRHPPRHWFWLGPCGNHGARAPRRGFRMEYFFRGNKELQARILDLQICTPHGKE